MGEGLAKLKLVEPAALRKQISTFMSKRLAVLRRVRDAMALAQDQQKENAARNGRKNKLSFKIGDFVLLNATA